MELHSDKNRHKPYLMENNESNTAILFIHGIYGSPVQFDAISKMLYDKGYSIMAILLSGHGGDADDFTKVNTDDWYSEVKKAVVFLKEKYDRVILTGHSMGGLLALNESLENSIDGIILMSVPMNVRVSYGTVRMSARILWGHPENDDDFLESYRHAYSIEDSSLWQNILWLPKMTALLKLIMKTRKNLSKITTPVLIIQSRSDETVRWKSAYILRKKLTCATELLLLKKSGHSYYHTDEFEQMKDIICAFVEKCTTL